KANAEPYVQRHRMRVGNPSPLPCFNGQFGIRDLGEGQTVHLSRIEQDAEFETSFTAKTGMLVTIILEGRLEFALDGKQHVFCAEETPLALAWMNLKPVEVVRRSRPGDRLIKVQVHTPLSFLDEDWQLGTDGFLSTHLQVLEWHPGLAVSEAAQDMVRADTLSPVRSRMVSSRFAIEALDSLLEHLECRQSSGSNQRIAEARAYVEHTACDRPGLKDIAAATGYSVSALQRAYRLAYGMTVIEHQRKLLLDHAMESLRAGVATVSQASHVAGYRNPTNFTSAFARQFGIVPSQVRTEDRRKTSDTPAT
ncbi:MAG: AraC family transcriptional regulator, partial [Pseudomonadota bacterium]